MGPEQQFESPAKEVTPEELAKAEADLQKALQLRDSDPETAVELLGHVLEVRNKAYGEDSLDCAGVYLYYGQILFEVAQASSDYFGDQMKSAALQRAKQLAGADADADTAAGDGDNAASNNNGEQQANTAATAAEQQDEAAEDASMADAAAAADVGEASRSAATKRQLVQTAEPADPAASETAEPPAKAAARGNTEAAGPAAEVAEAADENYSSDADDATADEAAEGEKPDEDAAGLPVEVTGESDDMALAWEMLEMARVTYNKHGGAKAHASKLADCHMYIADILCEQENFEAALREYETAIELVGQLEGGLSAHKRRAAELHFKRATALQLIDQPAEGLQAMQTAKKLLQEHMDELLKQLNSSDGDSAASGDSSAAAPSVDVASAVAFSAFASILSSYSAPAPAAPPPAAGGDSKGSDSSKTAADVAGRKAKQQQEIADIQNVLDSVNDRIEELTEAVKAHANMRKQIRDMFALVGAGSDGPGAVVDTAEGASSSAAAAVGGAGGVKFGSAGGDAEVTIGFGPVGAAKQVGAPVQDIGVIGKGRRVAPTPVAAAGFDAAGAATAANGASSADTSSKNKRSLADLMGPAPAAGEHSTGASLASGHSADVQQAGDAKKARA